MKTLCKIAPLFALLLWLANAAHAQSGSEPTPRTLFIFGDSWSDQMSHGFLENELPPSSFDIALIDREFDSFVTVVTHAVGGTTMDQWANDQFGRFTALKDDILNDPNPNPIVFFTLGGNDILINGSPTADILEDLETVLTELEALRPDLDIVYGQYDQLNVNAPPLLNIAPCPLVYLNSFGGIQPQDAAALMTDVFQQTTPLVAQFERVQFNNTYGTLQGSPGNLDNTAWSPLEYMRDCIHLTDDGYDFYLNTTFEGSLTPLLCEDPAVTVAACPSVPTAVALKSAETTPAQLLPVIIFTIIAMTAITIRRRTN